MSTTIPIECDEHNESNTLSIPPYTVYPQTKCGSRKYNLASRETPDGSKTTWYFTNKKQCHKDAWLDVLDHENIISCEYVSENAFYPYFTPINSITDLTEESIWSLARDVLHGISYLQTRRRRINAGKPYRGHGDIKPDNIVYDKSSDSYKLIDVEIYSGGTSEYISHETGEYDDVFSLGLTILQLLFKNIEQIRISDSQSQIIMENIIHIRDPRLQLFVRLCLDSTHTRPVLVDSLLCFLYVQWFISTSSSNIHTTIQTVLHCTVNEFSTHIDKEKEYMFFHGDRFKLGSGAYKKIYLGFNLTDRTAHAYYFIQKPTDRELNELLICNNKKTCQLIKLNKTDAFVVSKYYPIDLQRIISMRYSTTIDIYELAKAILQFFDPDLLHRDIKPGNIMQDIDGHFELIDYGLATSFKQRRKSVMGHVEGTTDFHSTTLLGTSWYMAPELYLTESSVYPYSVKSDIYALGVVLLESYFRENAFSFVNEKSNLRSRLTEWHTKNRFPELYGKLEDGPDKEFISYFVDGDPITRKSKEELLKIIEDRLTRRRGGRLLYTLKKRNRFHKSKRRYHQ